MVVGVPRRATHLEAEGIYQEVRQESTKIMQTSSRRSFSPQNHASDHHSHDPNTTGFSAGAIHLYELSTLILSLAGQPRGSVSANSRHESKQVICRPLLGNLSVHHSVIIYRIPLDVFTRCRNSKEVTFVCSIHRRAHGHDISLCDDIQFDIPQVWEGCHDCADQPNEISTTLDSPQGSTMPLDISCHVLACFIRLVLVKCCFDKFADNPLVFLSRVLRSHEFFPPQVPLIVQNQTGEFVMSSLFIKHMRASMCEKLNLLLKTLDFSRQIVYNTVSWISCKNT